VGAQPEQTVEAVPPPGDDEEDRPVAGPSAPALARRLRQGRPAVVARVERDHVLCDPRTVQPDEDAALLAALQTAWGVTMC
jgi:hypothetical protein